eukprot:UN24805
MSQGDWESGVATDIHICWAAALEFCEQKKDRDERWPKVFDKKDEEDFFQIAQNINKTRKEQKDDTLCVSGLFSWEKGMAPKELDETRVRNFARYYKSELTGLCAFLGGAVAQEVVKKFGKYKPISQWLHYDDQHLIKKIDDYNKFDPSTLGLSKTRYAWQVAILGKEWQETIGNWKVFLVGCGALGCEYLKGLSLMGVAAGKEGKIWVTDMDRIEVSNLSRQFLFRQDMVGKPKSTCGAKVVKAWNKDMEIESLEKFVGPKTEDFFDDDFWQGLNLCWNALDNVKARKYTDQRCLFYSKPLLESGTLGTKCNSEVILPHMTKSYNDGVEDDNNETQIAMCTLRNFPYLPLHCIEYAKQQTFSTNYIDFIEKYELFRKSKEEFVTTIDKEGQTAKLQVLTRIKELVEAQKGGVTFEKCVQFAFDQMVLAFRNNIKDLIHSYPEDKKTEGGKPFWSKTKRFPEVLDFSFDNKMAMDYLYNGANLYAFVFGLDYVRDRTKFADICKKMGLKNPEYSPKEMEAEEDEEEKPEGEEEEENKDKETKKKMKTWILMKMQTKLKQTNLKQH